MDELNKISLGLLIWDYQEVKKSLKIAYNKF